MSITFQNDNQKAIMEALMNRRKGKPPPALKYPQPSGKLVVKPKKDSVYIGGKLTF